MPYMQDYKREKLSSTLNRLGRSEQSDISVLNYLRETSHADPLVAVELYEVGAVSSIVKSLRVGIQTPKVCSALQLITASKRFLRLCHHTFIPWSSVFKLPWRLSMNCWR